MHYVEFELGPFCLDYLRGILHLGGRLGLGICNLFELAEGRVLTYLPEASCPDKLPQLRAGGLADGDCTWGWLLDSIRRAATDRFAIMVARSMLSRPHDPVLRSRKMRVLVNVDEVYCCATNDELPGRHLEDTIRFAESLPWFYGVVASSPAVLPERGTSSSVRGETLDQLCRGLRLAFFSAFDGEGYLIWYPSADSSDRVRGT